MMWSFFHPENISSPNTKQAAIAEMVGSIQSGESRYFFVGVVGYFIEGYVESVGLATFHDIPEGVLLLMSISKGVYLKAKFMPD